MFVSPMGEPFRGGGPDAPAPADAWFKGADRNGDGQITLTEMMLDAARFFRTLDVDGNGEIGPQEIDRYETEILPEVQSGESFGGGGAGESGSQGQSGGRHGGGRGGMGGPGGGMGGGGMEGGGMGGGMGGPGGGMGGGMGGMGGGGRHGGGRGGPSGGSPGGEGGPSLRGAARFGYLALPEPVIAADTDMNRAVTMREFQAAAQRRFGLLDVNGDGVLTQAELPRLGGPGGRRGGGRPAGDRMPIEPEQQ
ncbi:EF-hand domain-containing protein [Sphingomonas nostoxanthinifaciens]|uniref:EF-hand domain-containing protein n=1 Tax=Sphingomonas nostoxanthinifaciens TaxID=2872652 RepID=UPI001CC1E3DB|nr:EF-hand domain-containing protein [Sphingomonas nostoxanthinifaciens]UAK25149.1 EF-hand domain-containing protein [Sphingomonas nostoxanthinifaciens]